MACLQDHSEMTKRLVS